MKKLKIVYLIGIVMFLAVSQVQAQGIEFFHGTFKEAQVKAQKEGKLLFMDFYTSWCGPCKVMARNYFTLESVGKVYNAKYICLKVDAEKGEGPALAKKYGVKVYPTLVYAKPDGTEIKQVKGLKKEQQLIELAK
ncbi:thioredoxin [Puteibacter caeruleilacunae]|nr:thioredoxin [Puteibacter caeruleilacunae]